MKEKIKSPRKPRTLIPVEEKQGFTWLNRSLSDLSTAYPDKRSDLESNNYVDREGLSRVFWPAMVKFVTKITVQGLSNAENVALLLTDLHGTVASGFPDASDDAKGRILTIALKNTLDALKADVAARQQPLISLPETPSANYVPRKSGKASNFLIENYGKFIDAGVCFRPDIKRLDPKLEMALTNEFRGRTEELRQILPTRSDATDARLAAEFGAPVRPDDRKAAMVASALAKRLKR